MSKDEGQSLIPKFAALELIIEKTKTFTIRLYNVYITDHSVKSMKDV